MKKSIIVILIVLLSVATQCGPPPTPSVITIIATREIVEKPIQREVDRELGIVCYYAFGANSVALDCLPYE